MGPRARTQEHDAENSPKKGGTHNQLQKNGKTNYLAVSSYLIDLHKSYNFVITLRSSVSKSNTILVLFSEAVFLKVIPFWYYFEKP